MNEFFSKDHLRKKTCNQLQDNNIYDRVTRTFYNSGENLKRGQFHETYKCVMRNLPPAFIFATTNCERRWLAIKKQF